MTYELDKEQAFWGKVTLTAFVILTLTVGSCNIHVDYRIAEAIKQGADPVLARAAFSNSDGTYERIMHMANESGSERTN